METNYFDELINRYKLHNLTVEEQKVLESWLDSIDFGEENQLWTEDEKQVLKCKIMQIQSREVQKKSIPLWKRFTVAASLLLILGTGILFYKLKNNHSNLDENTKIVQAILPGGDKGLLLRESGSKVELNTLRSDTVYNFDQIFVERIAENEIKIEAAIGAPIQMQHIKAPKGGNFIVQLEDGSRLTLNANSSISFPSLFADDLRTVETRGEVFFEITKDPQNRPFVVTAGNTKIKVLGTKFNVNYKEGAFLRTSLFEGAVLVTNPKLEVKLTPGKEIDISADGSHIIKEFELADVGAWKNGYFSLNDKNILEIMQEIGNWYDVEVVYEKVDLDIRYKGSISKFSDINNVIEILNLAKGNSLAIKERRIIVKH